MEATGKATARLDEVIHAPTRLSIMTILNQVDFAEFAFLRDSLDTTDGNLSSHLRVLEQVGYISIHKEFVGRRPRTSAQLTDNGRSAFRDYIAFLQDVIARASNPVSEKDTRS